MNVLKQWIRTKKNITIKKLNDHFDKIIDKSKSKSFEDQIKSLKKVEKLNDHFINNFDDKELKSKIFKIKLVDMSNTIDEKLFKKIFGHTLIKLADKLINTTDKEKNQIIVKNSEKNKNKLFKEEKIRPYNFVAQPQQHADLRYTIDLILDFNEELN